MSKKLAILAICTAYAFATAPAYATIFTWKFGTGGGVDTTSFNENKNWQPASGPPGTVGLDDEAVFANEGSLAVTLNGSTTINALSFSADAAGRSYVLSSGLVGNVLTIGSSGLTSGGIVNNSGTAQTVGFNLALGADQSYSATAGALTFNGSTIDLGANALTVTGDSATSIANIITGTGSLTKAGNGTLTVTSANDYTGATTVSGGALVLGAAQTLAGPVTLGNGALTQGAGIGNSTFGQLVINGAATINLDSTSTSRLTFSGADWLSGSLLVNNWQGTAGSAGSAGTIFLDGSVSPNFVSNLGNITFDGFAPGAAILGGGELVPVPEPSTYAAIFALGLLGFAIVRRQMLARA